MRRASRSQAAWSSGASVTTTPMHDPSPGSGPRRGGRGRILPTGCPATVSRSALPKFVSNSTPTVWPDRTRREAVPIPDFQPRLDMPVPAPTAPSAGGTAESTESAACRHAAATSPVSTCIRRTSLRNASSHSATTGITVSSPMAGTASVISWHAASYTRPTCMVEVRKTGVPMTPHSCMSRKPVHSPHPLSTAPPAGTGRARMSSAGRITVTPVRAIPRPAGGSGSSRHIVA